jgi:hypothetical protein
VSPGGELISGNPNAVQADRQASDRISSTETPARSSHRSCQHDRPPRVPALGQPLRRSTATAPRARSFRDATEPRFCPGHGRAAPSDAETTDLGSPPPAARRGIERRTVGRGCSISRPRGPTPFTRRRNPKTKLRAAARKGSDSKLLYVCTRQRAAALLRSRSSRRSLRGRVVCDGVGTRTSTWTALLGEGFVP